MMNSILLGGLLATGLVVLGTAMIPREEGLARLIEDGAQLELLADGFRFTEGPASDAAGNVFFTDQPNDRILRWGIDGKLTTFMQPSGRSNGTFFDRDGRLIACADDKNQLWSIGMDGDVKVLVTEFQGKLLNGPNDAWVRPDGGIYFTDPFYLRAYWTRRTTEQEVQGVYYLPPGPGKLVRVISDLVQPNGIVGTPDGKILYVADIGGGKTYRYAVEPDGSLSGKSLFCEMGSDGMTLDQEGNLYLTGKGVTVFDREGVKLGTIPVDRPWTANVCFGGADHRQLFITASDALFSVRMKVRGAY